MHHRHVVASGCGEASSCAHAPPVVVPATTKIARIPRTGKTRKRRKKFSTQRLLKILDEDTLATLIQAISAVVITGCGMILLTKWVREGDFSFGERPRRPGELYPKKYLPPSSIYKIPAAMSHVGDKSDAYATLRKEYDALDLPEIEQQFEFAPLPMQTTHSDQVPYDIYDCPDTPPQGYPFDWNMMDILNHWPADDPEPRPEIHQGLCVFDVQKPEHLQRAYTYRRAELPFVIVNDPQVQGAVKRWNSPGYMDRMLGKVRHRAEYSENNHFMYWNMPPSRRRLEKKQQDRINHPERKQKKKKPWQIEMVTPKDWAEPTKMMRMTYEDWLSRANVTDESLLGPDHPHWYFRLIGCGETGPEGQCDKGSSEYLYDELPFFQPRESLYIVEPDKQKGIHCRFGMKGVIAENHFDGSRNMIAVLGGERRYVLAHPNQCEYLSLLPKGHPSARHSAVDWSDPDLSAYPEFQLAKGNEVVLQAGDVLYLPTNWFHYIISLSLNFQCNTRSGISPEYMAPLRSCGF